MQLGAMRLRGGGLAATASATTLRIEREMDCEAGMDIIRRVAPCLESKSSSQRGMTKGPENGTVLWLSCLVGYLVLRLRRPE
jgi:hypothetical protein